MTRAGVHTRQPSSTAPCGSRPALVVTTIRRTRPSTRHATVLESQTGPRVSDNRPPTAFGIVLH
jgi:hypothetical protein